MTLLGEIVTDIPFWNFYKGLPENEQRIVRGELELYLGSSRDDAKKNFRYAMEVAQKYLKGEVQVGINILEGIKV